MKQVFMSIVVIIFFATKSFCQTLDTLACKKIEDTLHVLKKFLDNNNSDPNLKRIGAIYLLQNLSGIQTTSPISFIGPEYPTHADYAKWMNWYVRNQKRLRFDMITNSIFVEETK